MELTADEWRDEDEKVYEGAAQHGIAKLRVDPARWLTRRDSKVDWEITVFFDHQCDAWEVSNQPGDHLEKIGRNISEVIADLQEIKKYVASHEFRTFLIEKGFITEVVASLKIDGTIEFLTWDIDGAGTMIKHYPALHLFVWNLEEDQ